MSSWAHEEVMTDDLGDRRLDERLAAVLEQLGRHPQLSIPAACGGWAETVAAYRAACAQWIVRAAQDRRLRAGEDGEGAAKLWAALGQAAPLGSVDAEVKPRPGRAARLAHVTLRAATVRLKPSARVGHRLPGLSVNAVLAREESPPPGAEALEWLLHPPADGGL